MVTLRTSPLACRPAAAAVALAERLVPLLGFLGRAAEPVAVVAVTVILTYMTLVIGELNPVEGLWSSLKAWSWPTSPVPPRPR
jgi:putative hemolysin